MIGFVQLRARLIEHTRDRIRNGEMTERGLALRAGISQPHLHNILKGVRSLNARSADALLAKLGATALDLLGDDELRRALFVRLRDRVPALEVSVLKGRLEAGCAFPDQPSPFECVKVPFRFLSHLKNPMVARLGEDSSMSPVVQAGDLVLLDASRQGLRLDDPDALFAIVQRGEPAVRWLRKGVRGVYVLCAANRQHPLSWELLSGNIWARAILLRSMHEPVMVFDPLARPAEPVERSSAIAG